MVINTKLIFLDESEKQNNKTKSYFAMCGLIVDADNLIKVERALASIKEEHALSNLKELRTTNMPQQTRLKVTEQICILLMENECKVISAVLGNITLNAMKQPHDRYNENIYFIMERFYLYLKNTNHNGIVFMDSIDNTSQKYLRRYFFETVHNKTFDYFGNELRFRDKLFSSLSFLDDEHSNVLQTTDLIATSLNSAIWKIRSSKVSWSIEDLPNHNKFLNIYWKLFNKSRNGEVRGYGIKWWS